MACATLMAASEATVLVDRQTLMHDGVMRCSTCQASLVRHVDAHGLLPMLGMTTGSWVPPMSWMDGIATGPSNSSEALTAVCRALDPRILPIPLEGTYLMPDAPNAWPSPPSAGLGPTFAL